MALRAAGVLTAAALALALAAPAHADVRVAAGQSVGDLTVFADDVEIDGTAMGAVTVLGGSLTLGPHARLADGATVLGGRLTLAPGARVVGDVRQLGGDWPLPEGLAAAAIVLGALALRFVVMGLVVAAAVLLARRGAASGLSAEARAFPLRTLLVGMLAGFGVGAISVLCAITLLGLVAAAALWGLLLLASVAGVAMALQALRADESAKRLAAGTLLTPILGELLLALAMIVGLGAGLRVATGSGRAPLAGRPAAPAE